MNQRQGAILLTLTTLAVVGVVGLGIWLFEGEEASSPPQSRLVVDKSVGFGVWTDTDTGCRYFVSNLPGGYATPGSQGIPTLRYRADGKPDCPKVE